MRESLRLRVRWVQELTARAALALGQRLVDRGVLTSAGGRRQPAPRRARRRSSSRGGSLRARPAATAFEPGPPLPASFRLTDDGVVVPVGTGARRRAAGAPAVAAAPARSTSAPTTAPSPGDVLVVRTLDPGLAPLLPGLGGLVAETGSVLSHLAILAREYGVPTVVGLAGATERFADGTWVVVDGTHRRGLGVWTPESGVRHERGSTDRCWRRSLVVMAAAGLVRLRVPVPVGVEPGARRPGSSSSPPRSACSARSSSIASASSGAGVDELDRRAATTSACCAGSGSTLRSRRSRSPGWSGTADQRVRPGAARRRRRAVGAGLGGRPHRPADGGAAMERGLARKLATLQPPPGGLLGEAADRPVPTAMKRLADRRRGARGGSVVVVGELGDLTQSRPDPVRADAVDRARRSPSTRTASAPGAGRRGRRAVGGVRGADPSRVADDGRPRADRRRSLPRGPPTGRRPTTSDASSSAASRTSRSTVCSATSSRSERSRSPVEGLPRRVHGADAFQMRNYRHSDTACRSMSPDMPGDPLSVALLRHPIEFRP